MPRNNYSALPELSSLVRWTVQDVINWLDKNKLSSCAKVFREAGIDGNKLYNSTEADLSGIGCPRKDLVVICDLIKQAQPQKGRGAYKQPVPNIQAPPRPGPAKNQGRDDDSGSDDDCMWSDNEFSDEDDGNDNYLELDNPVPPPSRPLQRGQRRPSYQDVTIGGSYNDEGGSAAPQPSVPGRQQRAPPPVPQDNHVPDVRGRPQLPGLRPQPSPPQNDDNEEFYEEPDKQTPAHSRRNVPQPPLPVSSNVRDRLPFGVPERPPVHQSPKMGRGRKVSPPQEIDYEEADQPQPPPSSRHVPRPKPAAQPPQEDYEVLDRPDPTPPVPRLHPSKQHKGRAPAPIPADDDQEDYEQPDLSGADPSRFSHQRPGISILPTRTEPKHHPMKNSSSRSRGDPLPPTPKNVPSPAKAFNSHAEEPKGNKSAHGDNDESDLDRQKWYHGDMKRAEANSRLMRYKVDGMYLIRKSTQGQDRPYTMQIFYQGKDFNLPIRLLSHNNQYALGAHKAGETTFPTLRAMVNFFKKNFLVLAGGYQTTLVQSLPKS